ncbi:MAG TPA: L,D-transpeptidase family protein, partial [Candidatus Sulfotelmatobacter sp.]
MTYVVLRPYWNVPPSILRGEIVRSIQRDRNYVAIKRYEVTTNDGTVVTSGVISDEVLADLKAGKLAVRQKPGPTNALGLVKLMFPNEFNVYLHSTPAPELFSRARRDFSHGCIRMEKPAELTAWVSGRRWRIELPRRWPPSAAQTVHADFPHTAFTKTQASEMPKKEAMH